MSRPLLTIRHSRPSRGKMLATEFPYSRSQSYYFSRMIRWVLELHNINGKKGNMQDHEKYRDLRYGAVQPVRLLQKILIGNEEQNEPDKRHKANSCYWAMTQHRFWCDLICQKSRWYCYIQHNKQMCRSLTNQASGSVVAGWLEIKKPNEPSAAAWSAHLLPKFPECPCTCCKACVWIGQIAWTAGMQVPVEHEYGIGSRPSIHQQSGIQK